MESFRITFTASHFMRRGLYNHIRHEPHHLSRSTLCGSHTLIRSYTKDAIVEPSSTKKDFTNTENVEIPSSSQPSLPPHSLLPTKMLVRSALVSTISSRPFLLNMALRTLTFLSSTRIGLLRVDRNPLIHAMLKQTFYNHFCAGENGKEVSNTIRNLKDIGFKGVILTYAREIVVDSSLEEKGKGTLDAERGITDELEPHSPDIESWKDGVLLTVSLLQEGDFLALKMTGAGACVMKSLSSTSKSVPNQMSLALEEICTAALHRNVKILVDAEQQSIQKGIDAVAISLMRKYNTVSTVVYNTYQAYLKSTPETLREHMQLASTTGFALGVKLVRGAYIASEPRYLIHDTKADTDECYNGIARDLLTQSYHVNETQAKKYPNVALFLATHNKDSAIKALELHRRQLSNGKPSVDDVQYGQLLGMADEVSCTLLQMGKNEKEKAPEVYKCLSWGPLEDCLSYLLRRARENKDAVGRSRAECTAVWAELRRRMRRTVSFSG